MNLKGTILSEKKSFTKKANTTWIYLHEALTGGKLSQEAAAWSCRLEKWMLLVNGLGGFTFAR